MPTPETALVYPGGCLIEGTNLSEGRGTTRPFELWGAPFVDGHRLARELRIEGAVLRPVSFTPAFHKHAGQRCGGVQVHVEDAARLRPYAAYVRMLCAVRAQVGPALALRTEPYEYVSDRPALDLLTGGPEVRGLLDLALAARGALPEALDAWQAQDEAAAAAFAELRRPFLLY